jgi:K+/H+ antiporter YhaU regulatory subunit KhtT
MPMLYKNNEKQETILQRISFRKIEKEDLQNIIKKMVVYKNREKRLQYKLKEWRFK